MYLRPLDNPNPTIIEIAKATYRQKSQSSIWMSDDDAESAEEEDSQIDSQEIFDLIRSISDPEFPLSSLEDLQVVSLDRVRVEGRQVTVEIRPTQPHCSSAGIIGLAIAVRLMRSLPAAYRVHFAVMEGSYNSADELCKQLNDKERVAAACESPPLLRTLETMLERVAMRGISG